MKKFLKKIIRRFFIKRIRKEWIKRTLAIKTGSLNKLSMNECQEVRNYWGQLGYKVNLETHKLFKTVFHYDKRFVPNDLYVSLVLPSLNPRMDSSVYVNKGMYDVLFKEIPQPKCYVKNISGVYWVDSEVVCVQDAIDYLNYTANEFIIKPAKDVCGGKNVRKINLSNIAERVTYLKQLFCEYKQDFVVQEIIRQHKETAQFNPESLNTFRICSLFLNGKFSILTSLLRCGQNGSIVDNGSAGGIMIPVSSDGYLAKYGLDHFLKLYEKSFNGISFDGICIKNYSKLESFIRKYYRLFPTCSLIAWDLAINEFGEPLMIEVNLCGPGIIEEQVSIGPFFGDRTDEVIEYVKTHPGKLYMSF